MLPDMHLPVEEPRPLFKPGVRKFCWFLYVLQESRMEFYFTRVHSSDFIQVQAVLDFSPGSAIYFLLT